MKKIFYLLPIIMLMMSVFVACTPDDDKQDSSDKESAKSYEVTSDMQLPMSLFLSNIPEEYAAFGEALAYAFTLREDALEQALGNIDIQLGFRKVSYTYLSTDVKGEPITLSAAAFWLGYFDNDVWNDLKPDNICQQFSWVISLS